MRPCRTCRTLPAQGKSHRKTFDATDHYLLQGLLGNGGPWPPLSLISQINTWLAIILRERVPSIPAPHSPGVKLAMVDPGLAPVPVVEGLRGGGGPQGPDPASELTKPGGLPPPPKGGPGEGAEGSCRVRPPPPPKTPPPAPDGDGPLLPPPPPSCRVPLLAPAGVRCSFTRVTEQKFNITGLRRHPECSLLEDSHLPQYGHQSENLSPPASALKIIFQTL